MATLETQQLDEIIVSTRRKMLTLSGAALASMAFSSTSKAQTATLTDADYLNFALNLEYVESQFYTLAVSGTTIDKMGVGITSGGGTAGGTVTVKNGNAFATCKVTFTDSLVASFATQQALDERNHTNFLRTALGASAVAMPNINLSTSFDALAMAAGIGSSFDPFADDIHFLLGGYIFEDVGVTAYAGAAPFLTDSGHLDAAAGILAVEAYHAGLLRTAISRLDAATTSLGAAGSAMAAATKISALRASVDGSNSTKGTATQGDDIGLGTQQVTLNGTTNLTASTLVNASTTGSINTAAAGSSTNSLAFSRTAAQVLRIVYANAAGTPGGFFPAGLNGNVK